MKMKGSVIFCLVVLVCLGQRIQSESTTPDTESYSPDTESSTPDTVSSTPDTVSSTPDTASSTPDTVSSTPDTESSTPDTESSTPDTESSTPDTVSSTPDTESSTPDTETTPAETTTIPTSTSLETTTPPKVNRTVQSTLVFQIGETENLNLTQGSDDYMSLKTELRPQIENKLKIQEPDIIAVVIINLRLGSIEVDSNITATTAADESADELVAKALVRMIRNETFMVNNETVPMARASIGDLAITASTSPCEIRDTVNPCPAGEECEQQGEDVKCSAIESEDDDDEKLAIGLGIAVPLFVITCAVIAVMAYYKARRQSKHRKFSGSELSMTEFKDDVKGGNYSETKGHRFTDVGDPFNTNTSIPLFRGHSRPASVRNPAFYDPAVYFSTGSPEGTSTHWIDHPLVNRPVSQQSLHPSIPLHQASGLPKEVVLRSSVDASSQTRQEPSPVTVDPHVYRP